MLTLKVITTNLNGLTQTHLFTGDSISHREYFSEDHGIVSKIQKDNSTVWIIGDMVETLGTQKFIASDVTIHDENRFLKNLLFIAPKADCYITDASGQTVDSFFCMFEQ